MFMDGIGLDLENDVIFNLWFGAGIVEDIAFQGMCYNGNYAFEIYGIFKFVGYLLQNVGFFLFFSWDREHA